MTKQEWDEYKILLAKIYDYFGGPFALATFLKTSVNNIYTWRSNVNFTNNQIKRKIPLHHAKKIVKKMPQISLFQIRPDLFE